MKIIVRLLKRDWVHILFAISYIYLLSGLSFV